MIDRYRGVLLVIFLPSSSPLSASFNVFPMSEKHSSVKPPSTQTRGTGRSSTQERIRHGVGKIFLSRGRRCIFEDIFASRENFFRESLRMFSNCKYSEAKANGSRDLTIIARHSPSRHETKAPKDSRTEFENRGDPCFIYIYTDKYSLGNL